MIEIKHATDSNFTELTSKGTVLADFFAEWCGPCKMQSAVFEDMNAKNLFPAGVSVIKIDIDKCPAVTAANGIEVVPTMIIYKNGVKTETFTGMRSADELIQKLK